MSRGGLHSEFTTKPKPGVLSRFLRSTFRISILLSALVFTPLLALSHFNTALAGMLGDFADRYLPNPTLLQKSRKARANLDSRLEKQRLAQARQRATHKRAATRSQKIASNKGKRVLVRGAGALAVGWVPVIGVSADVYSLSEDFSDVCDLFKTMDELLRLLYLPDANLYAENYCDVPEQGMEHIKQSAQDIEFPWQDSAPHTTQ